MTKWRNAVILAILAVAAIPETAQACPYAGNQQSLLHDRLPTLEAGMVAAEVEIVTDAREAGTDVIETRVISMIRGDYQGATLVMDRQIISSCDGVPYPGSRGIAVGRVLARTANTLVIDPVRAPSLVGLRRQRDAAGGLSVNRALR